MTVSNGSFTSISWVTNRRNVPAVLQAFNLILKAIL